MERKDVIELACHFARQKGYDTEKYTISVEYMENVWQVNFYKKEEKPGPGDFFTVGINDISKTVEYLFRGK